MPRILPRHAPLLASVKTNFRIQRPYQCDNTPKHPRLLIRIPGPIAGRRQISFQAQDFGYWPPFNLRAGSPCWKKLPPFRRNHGPSARCHAWIRGNTRNSDRCDYHKKIWPRQNSWKNAAKQENPTPDKKQRAALSCNPLNLLKWRSRRDSNPRPLA